MRKTECYNEQNGNKGIEESSFLAWEDTILKTKLRQKKSNSCFLVKTHYNFLISYCV